MFDLGQILLIAAPAVAAAVALFVGIRLLRPGSGPEQNRTMRTVFGVLLLFFMVFCLLTSLAIGACLGVMSFAK
jgi:uncharacterized membrane protein SpoIIM required for sporulation